MRRGARLLYEYCEERGRGAPRREADRCNRRTELPRLDELERRGRANRVPGLGRVRPDEIAEIEPHARGIAALHSPETGVVDFAEVAGALARDVERAGGAVVAGCGVTALAPGAGGIGVLHPVGRTEAGFVIAARAVGQAGGRRRGAEGSADRPLPRRLPAASARAPRPGPGEHLSGARSGSALPRRTSDQGIDGEVLLGPSALLVGARDAYRRPRARPRPRRIARMARHVEADAPLLATGDHRDQARGEPPLLRRGSAPVRPELSAADVPGPAGIRAQALDRDGRLVDDFIVHRTERALHVRNAPPPRRPPRSRPCC